ncbi:FAD-binding protein [Anaeromyxobacter oryzae]|uniref:Glycerol-3-phosphate dehydrogenase subunit B n=1 Tax=Anaeromyxobacter oryzae TaxID=2918170 RepID=A0ABM7WQQ4_9BACT|nr:FAD-binding protein [Anaeromyxobacter oryzae]BDG01795.1 glycerol-3-phosphate dehydrogenase subunit B [Anaeromyxobacter oryzae]
MRLDADVLVIGGGMAGAVAALAARDGGARVVLARRAPGATALSSGAIAVAPDPGASPDEPLAWRRGPLEAARRLAARRHDHPYAVVGSAGLWRLGEALGFVARSLDGLLAPALERPRFLATPFGTAAGVALCQRSMEAGDLLAVPGPLTVCGFAGHLAFDAELVAAGLGRYTARGGPDVIAAQVGLPFDDPAARPHELARALERPGAAERLGEALRATPGIGGAGTVLLPPVLGLDPAARVPERIAAAAGVPIAETLSDVPSVPGLRLHAALEARLRAAGVAVLGGAVSGAPLPGAAVDVGGTAVVAGTWILASGRFVGGGVARRGVLLDPAFGLAVQAAEGREAGVHLALRPAASLTVRDRRSPQPLLSAGLRVDAALRPLDARGRPVHPRLLAAGAIIGGHEQATDGTGLGVAILTGFLAGRAAAGGLA